MTATFQLRLLGIPQVFQADKLVQGFRSHKALALLAYLACQAEAIPRTHLADLFWGEWPEARGRANLSWTLNNLKTLLPGCLDAGRHHVQFQGAGSFWLDTTVFHQLLKQGDPAALSEAVALYRGPFMDGFYLDDSAQFELWLVVERARWQEQASQALRALLDEYSRRGDLPAALACTGRLLELDPWREEIHLERMRLLALDGQRSAALAQYEHCRQILAGELGIEPDGRTKALYQAISGGTFGGKVEKEWHNKAAPASTLPAAPTAFVGRQNELAAIATQLDNPACRLLTLVGPGGVGKTRLALAAARYQMEEAGQTTCFVSLVSIDQPELLPTAIAGALNLPFYGRETPSQQLLDYMRAKELLLVLDNFEQLQPAAFLLADLLQNAPRLKLLVTSRQRLNLQAEWVLAIEGLSYPALAPLSLDDYPAGQLFLQTARRTNPRFLPTEADQATVLIICRLVGGLPLAIELAAGWVRLLSCVEIANEIATGLNILVTSTADMPERHRSLAAIFDKSWQQLGVSLQGLAGQLALFQGGAQREAIQAVTAATLPQLLALVDLAFLRKTENDRYEMSEALRQYALTRLRQDADAYEAALEQHGRYYLHWLGNQAAHLYGSHEIALLATIAGEIDNIRQAWRWAITAADYGALADGLEALYYFYLVRGWFTKGAAMLAGAMACLENGTDCPLQARLLVYQGSYWTRTDDL